MEEKDNFDSVRIPLRQGEEVQIAVSDVEVLHV